MPILTVPVLPCVAVDATVEFYGALGFDTSDRQTRPYLYLSFSRNDIAVHFTHAAPGLEPADELSGGCLFFVDDIASRHREYSDLLRGHYGRVPATGLPRITRLRPGGTRFTLHDPSGNGLVFIDRDESEIEYGGSRALSGLAKALDNVRILRDFKGDDALAARALDVAIARHRATAPRLDLARALADRAELAVALGDPAQEAVALAELTAMTLAPDEHAAVRAELAAVEALKRWLA